MVNFPRTNLEHLSCKLCALDPRTKLFSFILAIFTIFLIRSHDYIKFLVFFLWLFGIVILSHQKIRYYLINVLKIYPMIFFMSFLLPFTHSDSLQAGEILFSKGFVQIYHDGFISFIDLNIRSILIFTLSIIFISETSMSALLKTLTFLRFPKWIEAIVIYMQRFIHIIGTEFKRMHLAFISRSFNMSFYSKTKAIAKMSSIYFSRLIDRGERSHLAMVSRGFNGDIYTHFQLKWRIIDSVVLVSNIILFSLLTIIWI